MGGGAHPNEWRHLPKRDSHVRTLGGCSVERTGWERERLDELVQYDIRAFGITGDWERTALEEEV